jgi:phosphoadenosine phosphosulfate reductase
MFGFLRDAKVVKNRELTPFGELVARMGIDSVTSWVLMLCNLAYSPAFEWYIKNIPFNEPYLEERLILDMAETTKKAQGEFWNGFKTILDTNEVFKEIGLGVPDITKKVLKNGEIRKTMSSIMRTSWDNPIPEVVLYSLYKFAEACGEYYQFSLETLLDDSIERDGISPTRIFGLDRDTMVRILNGLSINYPEFISASFTLNLDNITLRSDKTSEDTLKLF